MNDDYDPDNRPHLEPPLFTNETTSAARRYYAAVRDFGIKSSEAGDAFIGLMHARRAASRRFNWTAEDLWTVDLEWENWLDEVRSAGALGLL